MGVVRVPVGELCCPVPPVNTGLWWGLGGLTIYGTDLWKAPKPPSLYSTLWYEASASDHTCSGRSSPRSASCRAPGSPPLAVAHLLAPSDLRLRLLEEANCQGTPRVCRTKGGLSILLAKPGHPPIQAWICFTMCSLLIVF